MIYAKVDVKLRDHERAHRAGEAMSTWTWGLLYAVEHESDGLLPAISLRGAWAGERDAKKHAAKLVQVGLWEKTDDGFRILRFSAKNETKQAIEQRRKETRERVAAYRNKNVSNVDSNALLTPASGALVPGSGSGSRSRSGSESREGESERETAGARYQQAYAEGIRRGKAGAWSWPGTKYAEWDLGKIIKDHCKDTHGKPYRGQQLLEAIEENAAQFASDVLERKVAQYYSAFEPRGCLKWLNEAALLEEARRVG